VILDNVRRCFIHSNKLLTLNTYFIACLITKHLRRGSFVLKRQSKADVHRETGVLCERIVCVCSCHGECIVLLMQQQQVHFQRHWKLQLVVFGALLKRDADVVRDLLRAGPLELELTI
jgi:hypothetical protein